MSTNSGNFLILACYRSPNNNNNLTALEIQNFNILVNNFNQYLLLGDFNAHHPFWGSAFSCVNGRTLVENLDIEKFFLLNSGDPTHFYSHDNNLKYSCIDLTFISMSLAMSTNWGVIDDPWGSDHFPIEIDINVCPKQIEKKNFRFNLKKVHWSNFLIYLLTSLQLFTNLNFLNWQPVDRYQFFVDHMIKRENMESKDKQKNTLIKIR